MNRPPSVMAIPRSEIGPIKLLARRKNVISRRPRFWFLLVLTAFLIAACSDTSSTLGQFHQGRILVVKTLKLGKPDSTSSATCAMSSGRAPLQKIGWYE